jgi:hypothetical protein
VRRILAALVVLTPACTVVASLTDHEVADDAGSTDAQAVSDATTTDAVLEAGDRDAGVDGTGVDAQVGGLLRNGGFEEPAAIDCPGWQLIGAGGFELSTYAQSGTHACLVCPATAGKVLLAPSARVPANSDAGGVTFALYYAHPPDAGVSDASSTLQLEVDELKADGGFLSGTTTTLYTVSSSSWTRTALPYTPVGNGYVSVSVAITPSPVGDCILVDDITLTPSL